MKLKLLILALFSLVVACGQDKSNAVYDTDKNPDNFPPTAVELIKQIETGKLVGAEAITQAFSVLLTEHGDLLDRPQWRRAVDNMGGLFKNIGDSLVNQGIGSYSLAAEYYQLGALARPEDTALRHLNGLFGSWQKVKADPKVDSVALTGQFGTVDRILAVTHSFMFADSLCQEFFLTYLSPEIRKQAARANTLGPETLAKLAPADHALLVCVGLSDTTGFSAQARFSPPKIDLMGARITQLDTTSYRAEFYFMPRQAIPDPLKLYMRLDSQEGTAWPVEIVPQKLTTTWVPEQIKLVTKTFQYSGRLAWAGVGLSDFTTPRGNFLKLEDGRTELFHLAPADLILK
jgi:hypothetical protein